MRMVAEDKLVLVEEEEKEEDCEEQQEEEEEERGTSRLLYTASLVAALGGVLFGYDGG